MKNSFSSISSCLGLILDVVAVASILTKNKNVTLAVAEIMFYGLIKVLSYSGSKLVELIVTNIAKPLVVLKYAVKAILNYAVERFLSSKYIEIIKAGYMKNINVKKFTFGNCLAALFKGTKSIFA